MKKTRKPKQTKYTYEYMDSNQLSEFFEFIAGREGGEAILLVEENRESWYVDSFDMACYLLKRRNPQAFDRFKQIVLISNNHEIYREKELIRHMAEQLIETLIKNITREKRPTFEEQLNKISDLEIEPYHTEE
jgi:hypothetical protein